MEVVFFVQFFLIAVLVITDAKGLRMVVHYQWLFGLKPEDNFFIVLDGYVDL